MTADGVGERPVWRFGPFELNADACELTRAGERVNIEPQSMRLLEYLIQERARVVSRALPLVAAALVVLLYVL